MIIPIDEHWRLKSDEHCWHIQRNRPTRKVRGETSPWVSMYYFTRLEDACQHFVQLQIRLADGDTLTQALGEAETAVTALVRALAPHFEVTVR